MLRKALPFLVLLLVSCGRQEAGSSFQGEPEPFPDDEASASQIVIAYQGARAAEEDVTRSREEALLLATQVRENLRGGEDFALQAQIYSDAPQALNGGQLGIFGLSRVMPEVATALRGLHIGEISAPVETAYGFHILRREKVERVSVRHLLVAYAGAEQADPNLQRTRDEARLRCEQLLARVRAGEDLGELARTESDGPSGPRGGDLGRFGRGIMAPAFEEAAFSLPVGGISEVVETAFGFHILERTE